MVVLEDELEQLSGGCGGGELRLEQLLVPRHKVVGACPYGSQGDGDVFAVAEGVEVGGDLLVGRVLFHGYAGVEVPGEALDLLWGQLELGSREDGSYFC